MAAIEVGKICVKRRGRDAGKRCVITKVIDDSFVEIAVKGRKTNRKCAILHLEPLPEKLESLTPDEIAKAIQ